METLTDKPQVSTPKGEDYPFNEIHTYIVTRLGNVKRPNYVTLSTLAKIAEEIRNCPKLKSATVRVRETHTRDGEAQYKAEKEKLPAVVFAGNFTYANNDGLKNHSKLMTMDFDRLDTTAAADLILKLRQDKHTVLAFISPSGCGVKWVVAVAAHDAASHSACWHSAAAYAAAQYGVEADPSGKDVSRKCFLSHDPDAVIYGSLEAFTPTANDEAVILGGVGDLGGIGESRDSLSSLPLSQLIDVSKFLPDRPKNNHDGPFFSLARHVRGIESRSDVKFNPMQTDALVAEWYRLSSPQYRPNSLEDYQDEFVEMLEAVKHPSGEQGRIWAEASRKAKQESPSFAKPLVASRPSLGLLAALCYWLAQTGNGKFFLSQLKAKDFLGCKQPNVSALIARLKRMGWIALLHKAFVDAKSGKRRATWYRWTGPV